jgi:hypothetical protein
LDLKPIFDEAKQLDGGQALSVVLTLFALVCPGALTVWLFAPQLAIAVSTPKLLLLSASISSPFLLTTAAFSFFLEIGATMEEKQRSRMLVASFALGSMLTSIAFSVALTMAFFLHWTIRPFFGVLLVEQMLMIWCAHKVVDAK